MTINYKTYKRLDRAFFQHDALEVAKNLLGKVIIFGDHHLMITETEAYRHIDDPASHAFRGKTARNEIMFGMAGFTYVYLIYGIYSCLNFVTGHIDEAQAVLIRGARSLDDPKKHFNGPGKLCRALGIDKTYNGIDLTQSTSFYVCDANLAVAYETTPRIGISKAQEKLWRFVIKD